MWHFSVYTLYFTFMYIWPPCIMVISSTHYHGSLSCKISIFHVQVYLGPLYLSWPVFCVPGSRGSPHSTGQWHLSTSTRWPDKNGRVIMVPCKTWLFQCTLLYTRILDKSCLSSHPVQCVPIRWEQFENWHFSRGYNVSVELMSSSQFWKL